MGCLRGKTLDKHEDGPKASRHCTDCFFLILFIIFWAGMIVVAVQAGRYGNPYKLIYGQDYEGNVCGIDNSAGRDMSQKPYVYYIIYPTLSYIKICVEECPATTHLVPTSDSELICPYYNNQTLTQLFPLGRCFGTYASEPEFYRCIPTEIVNSTVSSSSTIFNDLNLENAEDLSYRILSDLVEAWKYILAFSIMSVVVAFVWLILLRLMAGPMVWLTILGALGVLGACAYVVYNEANTIQDDINKLPADERLASESDNEKVLRGLSYALAGLAVVLLLIVLAMIRRIQLAIQVVKEASRAVGSMPSIFFFPIVVGFFLLALAAYWIGISALLGTAGTLEPISTTLNPIIVTGNSTVNCTSYDYYYVNGTEYSNCTEYNTTTSNSNSTSSSSSTSSALSSITYDNMTIVDVTGQIATYVDVASANIRYLQLYHLFGGFWTLNLILAIGHATVAGAIASWYWVHDKRDVPHFAIFRAFATILRYHLGSLAFGSLILAVVQFIQYLLSQFERRVKGKEARMIKFLLAIVQCCLSCFERFIKFLNKNAYIMIAMYGYSFCGGARRAFTLLLKNVLRVAAVTCISNFLMFLGKLFICVLTSLVAFLVIKDDANISFYAIPVFLIAIISYAVATAFFSVYDMAIDTILLCFCEDSDRNDGSAEKPYFMSESLKHFVSSHKIHGCCCSAPPDDEQTGPNVQMTTPAPAPEYS